jgi:hypothetical protein
MFSGGDVASIEVDLAFRRRNGIVFSWKKKLIILVHRDDKLLLTQKIHLHFCLLINIFLGYFCYAVKLFDGYIYSMLFLYKGTTG